jgi:hypothetical protein
VALAAPSALAPDEPIPFAPIMLRRDVVAQFFPQRRKVSSAIYFHE